MSWEERLLFLMFLDYKGVLKKWERNHDRCRNGHSKIDDIGFNVSSGFLWCETKEGDTFWCQIVKDCSDHGLRASLSVPSLDYKLEYKFSNSFLKVGCQSITKKDALKIADFIYDCFGEEV